MSRQRRNEWKPFPPGIYMAIGFGSFSVIFLVYSWNTKDYLYAALALAFGVWAMFEAGSAVYLAGMRRESDSKRGIHGG